MADGRHSVFREGTNCWRVERADRIALLVDGDEYFRAFAAAAERARHSIRILAWDFDSRTRLRADERTGATPAVLGDFLNFVVRRRRGLQVRVLIWDYPMIFGTDREFPSVYGLGWKAHRRIRVRYDNTHPVTGSHHQKVVVVDDAVAFCGGLDLTCKRWDTRDHRPDDERRCHANTPYPPFHDVMMMVDGPAARRLGKLVRERWHRATGRRLGAAPPRLDPWPESVAPHLRRLEVAISRTQPEIAGEPAIREIEALYLDMIAAARRTIFVENQYFTSRSIGDALAARLAEPDGPEVVVVLRLLSHGWLEDLTMQNLRKALIARLREADAHGRLHVYYPHIDGLAPGTCIDIHSKVLVVDDAWLRIGSANVCNRSMGFDTECDLTIEAAGRSDVERGIVEFRDQLLGEHLGVEGERVSREIRERGSISGAIAALRAPGRTLEELEPEPEASGAVMTLAALSDLEQPVQLERLLGELAPYGAPQPSRRRRWVAAGALGLVAGLTALWRLTPLAETFSADNITDWAHDFADAPWAPVALVAAYVPASLVMFPRPLLTLFAVVAFGPWLGFSYAMTGLLLAALLTYVAGRRLDRSIVRRLSGPKLGRIIRVLRHRGLVAITALRLVPLAPFAVEGVIAGAIRVKKRDFLLGTALGMLPGTLAATVLGDQLEAGLRDPSQVNYGLLAAIVLALGVGTYLVRRWLLTTESAEGRAASR